MTLNETKCTVLHIGNKNPRKPYFVNGNQLEVVEYQKDLGVYITSNLKWETHIISITKKTNSILYIIRKAFFYIDKTLFLKLYKTYIRPLLEYAFQIWSPYFKKDIELLERVQRRATKMVPCLRNCPYEDRLKELGLTSLEQRRKRGDLIETYKILNKYYNVPDLTDIYIKNENRHLRGHTLKLRVPSTSSNPHKHFLPNRIVNDWNKLPQSVISAPSVNSFKNRLDNYNKNVH